MSVAYAIVTVYVTERNDVIKRHNNVITIWLTSAIEVTALLENLRSEFKRYAGKRIYHGCEGQIEKFVPRDHSLASLSKSRDARQ